MYPQRSVMTCGLATALEPPYFNHAPVRGATVLWQQHLGYVESFNPRTRVGCDGLSVRCRICYEVSIHAPAWGATWGRGGMGAPWEGVSIHAPAWGATWPAWRCGSRSRCFNPRTRVGCDTSQVQSLPFEERVSIHAPAWGATVVLAWNTCCTSLFQSTHPRGVRRHGVIFALLGSHVSIHAPAWGATGG